MNRTGLKSSLALTATLIFYASYRCQKSLVFGFLIVFFIFRLFQRNIFACLTKEFSADDSVQNSTTVKQWSPIFLSLYPFLDFVSFFSVFFILLFRSSFYLSSIFLFLSFFSILLLDFFSFFNFFRSFFYLLFLFVDPSF